MTVTAAPARLGPTARAYWVLSLVALLALVLGVAVGPTLVPLAHVVRVLLDPDGNGLSQAIPAADRTILLSLRLPRACLALLVGAGLGAGGAAAQGLFRNPLAEPGLVGVSSGATLGAALTIVLGGSLLAVLPPWVRAAALPGGAFLAGGVTTLVVLRTGGQGSRASTASVLLAGVAINALAGALVGFLSHLASDAELRNLTFWVLGGFGGASWAKVAVTGLFVAGGLLFLWTRARALDLFALGDLDARAMGVDVARLRSRVVLAVSLTVGAAVAAAGLIGFVGLLVPHFIRMWVGARHARLIPLSALGGACLTLLSDVVARVIVAPAELPVGLLTALLGAPFFLHLLQKTVKTA